MKITGKNLQILDKIGMDRLSSDEVSKPLPHDCLSNGNNNWLQAKNVILSGDFFHLNGNSFSENSLKREANVQLEITPETEVLICGKYPDWILVEDARLYGIKIIFVDKAGKYFSRIAAKLIKCKTGSPIEELIGV